MAKHIALDEQAVREEFIRYNAELEDKAMKSTEKELQSKRKRIEELSRMMQAAYEDKVKGKIPEDICVGFIEKYSAEQKTLKENIVELERKLSETETSRQNVDDFIRNIKKYLDAPEFTREMCYELIDRIVVGGIPKASDQDRIIDIVFKVDFSSVIRHKFEK